MITSCPRCGAFAFFDVATPEACPFCPPHGSTVHVYPQYGRAHETDGAKCWCEPLLESHGNGAFVYVHREQS